MILILFVASLISSACLQCWASINAFDDYEWIIWIMVYKEAKAANINLAGIIILEALVTVFDCWGIIFTGLVFLWKGIIIIFEKVAKLYCKIFQKR